MRRRAAWIIMGAVTLVIVMAGVYLSSDDFAQRISNLVKAQAVEKGLGLEIRGLDMGPFSPNLSVDGMEIGTAPGSRPVSGW